MIMLKENFEQAMLLAIAQQEKLDRIRGIEESAFAAGLKQILKVSVLGVEIVIKDKS
jgi:hypothetical protein